MTLSEIILECGEIGNSSTRVQQQWPLFVNRAVRAIAQRKNWSFLHARRPYVILSGQSSVSLGRDFKCLSNEESPISVSYQDGAQTFNLPVRVLSREEVERQLYWPWIGQYLNQPVPGGYVPIRVVFLERDDDDGFGGVWRLHIPPQFNVTNDSPYNVSAFYFPRQLKLGTDHNAVTDDPDLIDAVINYAKSLSYFAQDETNPRGTAARQLYEDHFTGADYTDVQIHWAGRTPRM